jgi:hypothetical protein
MMYTDFEQVFLDVLGRGDEKCKQALTAHKWLHHRKLDLRHNGTLQGELYGPVGMYCGVHDRAQQVMIEDVIGTSTLLGFVVDNDADAFFLKHQFREVMRLNIDIYTIKNASDEYTYACSAAELRELDLNGYLMDQLQCPPLVRALFCSFHALHNVLWRSGVDNFTHAEQRRLAELGGGSFSVYIYQHPHMTHYKGSISEFSGELSTISSVLRTEGGGACTRLMDSLIMNRSKNSPLIFSDADITRTNALINCILSP